MTRDECLAKAIELEATVARAANEELAEEYRLLAAQWRILAGLTGSHEAEPKSL